MFLTLLEEHRDLVPLALVKYGYGLYGYSRYSYGLYGYGRYSYGLASRPCPTRSSQI